MGPRAQSEVEDAHATVGGIPQMAATVGEDIVDTVVDETLPVEILMPDKNRILPDRYGKVYTARIGSDPQIAPAVTQKTVDSVALEALRGTAVGVEGEGCLSRRPIVAIDACAIDTEEQRGGIPRQNGTYGHQRQAQPRLGHGGKGAVVDGYAPVVEGAQPQPVGLGVGVGAQHRSQWQHPPHLALPRKICRVGSPNENAAACRSHMINIMAFEHQSHPSPSVDMTNATVEGCP